LAVREVVIPYYPREAFQAFHERTQRWAVIVAHRRAGKTVACVNDLIRRALQDGKKDGRYAYLSPYFSQAKAVAWDYLRRFAQPLLGDKPNETELRVDLVNGARIRLYGADNPDALRGLALDGVVLDEVADMRPRVWGEIIRPALADRQGWAVWIGTPKGHNAFHDVWQQAQANADWFALLLKASATGILPAEELIDARRTMSEDEYAQEFECSFEAAIQGAYYGKELAAAEEEGRISGVPAEKGALVHTAWDLGIGDSTAIWFVQQVGREVRVIDYYEASGVGLDHYAKVLQAKPYLWGEHIVPHDAAVRELGTGKTRIETLANLGIRTKMAPKLSIDDGIHASRMLLARCWFDRERTFEGLGKLKQYRREWDEERKTFKPRPLHDHSSHAADAFRYLAVGLTPERRQEPIRYNNVGIV
jgi:phage terminase large subunit